MPEAPSASGGQESPVPATPSALAPPELASRYRASLGTPRQVIQSNGRDKPFSAPVKVSQPPEVSRPEVVSRPSRWHRRSSRYAATGAVAAGLVVAIVFWPGSSGRTSAEPPAVSGTAPAEVPVIIPLRATSGTATSGLVTASKLPGGWSIKVSVHRLSQLASGEFYECWFAGAGTTTSQPVMISAGTFNIGSTGSAVVSMWSAADPRQFRSVEITAESASDDGRPGQVILRGVART